VFWKKKKNKCDHTWYHLQDTFISTSYGFDSEDACWIFCPLCKREKLVFKKEWERIEKSQEIMKQLNN
jgi:hypothetical protein